MDFASPSFGLWFDYDLDANTRVLQVLQSHDGPLPEDSIKLFCHIIAAHEIWNSRILGEPMALKVWEPLPINQMEAWLQKNRLHTGNIIDTMEGAGIITYENMSGKRFSNQIPDILFHVLTHSHYHRGQIARNLREHGITPAETNYITFRRGF